MVEIVFLSLFLIPAVLGLAEILHNLKCILLKPKKDIISYKIIVLTDDNPANQLLYAAEKFLWNGCDNGLNLIAVYNNLSFENFIECEKIAKRYDISFCWADELVNQLELIKNI